MSTVLETMAEALELWENDQRLTAQNLAKSLAIRSAAKKLLALPRNQKSLLAADTQRQLRQLMQPVLDHYRGYFIIAPDHISLASSRDATIGTQNLLNKYPDILADIWGGKTRLTPVQRSDVPLTTEVGKQPQPGDETLFVATPIRDDNGKIIALFALRIDPYRSLFTITNKGRLGESGESYLFDRKGLLLSRSRFDDQLARIGLLAPGQSSTTNLRITDPGVDLTEQERPHVTSTDLPLTRMAADAIKGNSGIDVVGYRDYRGVPVVGAWDWDEHLNIGIVTEQDVSEAYGLFYLVRELIYGGGIITAIIVLVLAWVFTSGKRQLAQLQIRLQAIVETANDGIIVINRHGTIESINPAMGLIFGYSAQEMIGSNVSMLMPEPHRGNHDGHLQRYLHTGESTIIGIGREVEGKRKDGTVFPMDLSVNELRLSSGIHFSGIIRDISERKEAEKNIVKAREEAIAANRAKSTFLATMSHEIRTPLNGVVSTIDMLAHTSLLPPQQDLVETAQDSAILLQGIIDDILDFSKIEAEKLELEQVPIALEPLVEKLGENLQHIAKTHGVELLIYVDPTLPHIIGDPVRLRQILYNLTGNAIKFSSDQPDRSGQVVVSILLQRRMDGRANICFQIMDNGIGMSPEVKKRLFKPFVQGEGETTRRFGGTGLGLVITQRLVEIMGGSIDITSAEGEGSTFTVHLTLEETTELPPIETSNLEGVKVVLLTRDEAAKILTSYLRHAGAEVVLEDANHAVEICKEQCVDTDELVVLIDTRGDLNSSTALRNTLRKVFDMIDRRFLFVERGNRRYARPHEEDGMTLDLNAMRRKTLLNAVAALAGRESPEQNIFTQMQQALDVPQSVDDARAQGRLILLADDNPTNRKVISQQLGMLGYLAETAENGAEALEMWRNGDYTILLTDCHMPVMDGYQLSESIRREEPTGTRIPIIATTADALKGTAQRCFDAGMDDYLTKPMKLQHLQETLEKWAPMGTAEDETETESASAQENSEPQEDIDPKALGNILGTQDPEMLADYYNDFLDSNAPTAKQIEEAFQKEDMAEISTLAHKLKSAARTVGANALADCCQALETAGRDGDAEEVRRQMALLPNQFISVQEWIEDYCK
ncbi:MAG: PAS domain S-box protein, partial [Gammaproteobacteria bacterium]